MKLAVISDIHGNYKALEAFLVWLQEHPVDGIVCLGDLVTDGPYPVRTMEMIFRMQEDYPCVFLRGNREEYLMENFYRDQGWGPSSQNGALYYTALHLREADIRFFESLPSERILAVGDCPALTLSHGIPGRVRGNVNQEAGLRDSVLARLDNRYLLGGHTHHQEIYRSCGRTYINPGSLGLAVDGAGRHAQFAVLTGAAGGWEAEPHTIGYDVDGFLRDFSESGLAEYGKVLSSGLKKTLLTGVNYFYGCVVRAMEISGLPLQEIPEDIWEQAGRELGL